MNHSKVYTEDYFKNNFSISFYENRLRMGDQFLAICYAFNISILEVFSNIEFENITHKDFCWDNHHGSQFRQRQTEFFKNHFADKDYLRIPKSILEIGSGRGEVVAFLNYCKRNIEKLNFEIQAVDPSPDFFKLYEETCYRLFDQPLEQALIQSTLKGSLHSINFENVDTIIFAESIEHIEETEFYEFIEYALPYFRKNNTRLIIVNAWGFWPIPTNGYDHIWEINDSVYDKIESLARVTILRSRSHLVIEF